MCSWQKKPFPYIRSSSSAAILFLLLMSDSKKKSPQRAPSQSSTFGGFLVRSRAAKAAGEMWSWQKKPFPYIRSSSSAAYFRTSFRASISLSARVRPKKKSPQRATLQSSTFGGFLDLDVVEMWNWPYIRRRSIFQVWSLRRKDVAIGVGGVVSEPAGSDIHARWAMVVDRCLSVDGR